MPPKKKPKSKKKKGKKEIDPEVQLRQDLLERALSLRGETGQENALEEQFRKQSESLRIIWEIEKTSREKRRRALLENEHRLGGIGDAHAANLGEYKRTVKELLFANQDEISEKTTRCFAERRLLSDGRRDEAGRLRDEVRRISGRIGETAAFHGAFEIAVRRGRDDDATAVREEARRRVAALAAYSEEQFRKTREASERRLMEETRELEARNEEAIRGAMDKNREEVDAMRTSYNAAMNENLDTITTLRREVVELREQDRHDRRALNELRNRNNDITTPLETNRTDLDRLASDLDFFTTQKRDLDAQTKRLRRAEDELKEIEWDREVLFQKLQTSEADRDARKKRAQRSIHSARQETDFRNLLLERELGRLSATGEKNTAAMAEILRRANIDLDSLDESQGVRVTDVINEKNEQVELLRRKLKCIKDERAALIERHRSLMEGKTTKSGAR